MMEFGCKPTTAEWHRICANATERRVKARDPIYNDERIAERVIFVSNGVAASYFIHEDGQVSLTRFFEPGHVATNVACAFTHKHGKDRVFAVSDVEGVEFSSQFVLNEYATSGDAFGRYIRLKIIETLEFEKDLLNCRSLNNSRTRIKFLETRYKSAMKHALKKDVAAFLGITPQAYSRLQKKHLTN
ncbi:MAG: hypothetical protein AAF222_00375 [Pseudomonadota bacterium]